jgi:hypothetical protein
VAKQIQQPALALTFGVNPTRWLLMEGIPLQEMRGITGLFVEALLS